MTSIDPRATWRARLPSGKFRGPALLVLGALGYFACAELGHWYTVQPSGIVVVWPAGGFLLGCLLLSEPRDWKYLLIGGALGNVVSDVLSGATVIAGIEASAANGLESWLAAWVVIRLAGRPVTLTTLRQTAVLVLGAAVASNAVTALVGTAALVHGSRMSALTAWLAWWIGDGLGMLLVTPFVVGLGTVVRAREAIARRTLVEGGVALIALLIVADLVLGRAPLEGVTEPYVLLPLLFVAVIRFRVFGASAASLVIGAVTIWHAAHGHGAFAGTGDSAAGQALRIYVFLATVSLTGLFASAVLSERERAYAQERRLAAILEATPDFVTIGRMEGPPLFVNRAARRALGIGPDEAVASLYEFRPAGFREFFETVAIPAAARDGSWTGETEYVSRTGRVIPVSQVSVVHTDADGRVAFISAIARDITDLKRSAEWLRQSEERMNLALEAAQAAAWVHDLSTNVITLSGTSSPHTLEDFLMTVHPDDREPVARQIQRQHESADRFDFEYREIRRDGTTHWVRTRGRVVRDAGGQPVRVLGVDLDITERKELEEQLRQAQKIEAVGQLAGGLAHDFNNLLTAILGYAQMLEDTLDAGDLRRLDTQEIRKAGERASQLTRQLLAFSRKQILRPVVLSVNDIIEGIGRMLARVVGEHVRLELKLDRGLARVKADPGQVEQILVNLAINAADAMEQGGTLTIETSNVVLDEAEAARANAAAAGPYVRLSVHDTGTGMTPETQRRIFEPFFTTKAVGKGTGMGLATVFGIVKQSGGTIAVKSQPGEGTTFHVYFPQTSEQPEAGVVRPPAVVERQDARTVLAVDDDPGVLMLVVAFLKRDGYTVLSARDPKTAVALGEGRTIDLLLTDVVMPGMDGPTLFAALRSKQPSMRVLYMSGFADAAIVQRGVLAPGTQFIPKPFAGQDLLNKVREALAGPKPAF